MATQSCGTNSIARTILPFDGKEPRVHPEAVILPGACIIGDVTIGARSSIWFNTVVRGDVHFIRIGEGTNIQDNCTLHVTGGKYSCTLGNNVTVGHGATIHACAVRDGALIGMNAVLLDDCEIGEECIVAAGAVVTPGTKVPPRSMVMGAPARVKRPLTDAEVAANAESARHYQHLAEQYRREGSC